MNGMTNKEKLHQITNKIAQIIPTGRVEQLSYELGYDCGKNVPTVENTHFLIFNVPVFASAWKQGFFDANNGIPMKKRFE